MTLTSLGEEVVFRDEWPGPRGPLRFPRASRCLLVALSTSLPVLLVPGPCLGELFDLAPHIFLPSPSREIVFIGSSGWPRTSENPLAFVETGTGHPKTKFSAQRR